MNDSFQMNKNQRSGLISKCKKLLCLALGDGSIISARVASTLNHAISQSAYDGLCSYKSFGNLPIVLLTNDVGMLTTPFESLWYSTQNQHHETNLVGKGTSMNGKQTFTDLT